MTSIRYHYLVLPSDQGLQSELKGLFQLVANEKVEAAVIYRSNELCETLQSPIERTLAQIGYTRIFEKFWLPTGMTDSKRRLLVQALFEFIARTYDSIITHDLNLHCYEHLYSLAVKRLHRSPSRLLDFGCGTGLITQSKFASQVPYLRGFDFCPKMAFIAREKGLCTIDATLHTLAIEGPFESVLASYVFHYGLTTDEWRSLLACIAKGGGLFGNFHKSIGLLQAVKSIESLDTNYDYEVTESDFGPVLAVYASPRG